MKKVLSLVTIFLVLASAGWAATGEPKAGTPGIGIFLQPGIRFYGGAVCFEGKMGAKFRLGKWLSSSADIPLFVGLYGSYGAGGIPQMNLVWTGVGLHTGYALSYLDEKLQFYPHLNMGLKWLQLTSTRGQGFVSYLGFSLEPSLQLSYRIISGFYAGVRMGYEMQFHSGWQLLGLGLGLHLKYGF